MLVSKVHFVLRKGTQLLQHINICNSYKIHKYLLHTTNYDTLQQLTPDVTTPPPRLDLALFKARYERDGYFVLDSFVPGSSVDTLKERITQLIQQVPLEELNCFFSTGVGQEKHRNQYFLTSGDKIRFFLEEKAIVKDGKLVTPKQEAINKVGHALHELDPVFRSFTITPQTVTISKEILGLKEPVICQSMYIMKQPLIGGEVATHQDSTYLYTTPETVAGMWFAIDDALIGNSCLWVAPGSHKGPLRTRNLLKANGDGTYHDPPLETITSWPSSHEFVPVQVKKGSLVVFHGRLCHKSDANTSPHSRHAYVFHVVDATARWDPSNWLQVSKPFMRIAV